MKGFSFAVISVILGSCGYWPFIDYYLPADFSKYNYHRAGSQDTAMTIFGNDRLKLGMTASVFLPNKKRSENLRLVWVELHLRLAGTEIGSDTLSIDLDESTIMLISDTVTIFAQARPTQAIDATNRLIFYGNLDAYQKSIHAEFHYTKGQNKILKSHQLKVDLKRIRIRDRYVDVNPVILEITLNDN